MSDTEKNTAPPPAADKKPGSALEADLTKYKVSFQFPVLTLFSPPLIPNNARSTTITDGWLIFIFFNTMLFLPILMVFFSSCIELATSLQQILFVM